MSDEELKIDPKVEDFLLFSKHLHRTYTPSLWNVLHGGTENLSIIRKN